MTFWTPFLLCHTSKCRPNDVKMMTFSDTHLACPERGNLVDKDTVCHFLELLRHDDQTFERFQQITQASDDHIQQAIIAVRSQ